MNVDEASPGNISVIADRTAVIVCPATGVPVPQITWFKDDVAVIPGVSSDVRVLSNGRRLEISGVQVEHAGQYRCLARNIAGYVDRQYQLHVLGLYSFLLVSTILNEHIVSDRNTGVSLPQNNEASAELTTANGGKFTSSSARLSSQSRYRSLDQ